MGLHTRADNCASLPSIGFLGLGAMGGAMARVLLRAGYPLTVFDPRVERMEACVSAGATAAESAAEVVRHSDVILTSLRSSAVFVEVAERDLLPNAASGHVFLDMGTTEPAETRRLAIEFAKQGATLLDAPASGGPGGAESGTLHIFIGGDRVVADRCLPILEKLGDARRVVYCGPSGSGQVVKGVNQLAMGLGNAAFLEALAYGVRAGVDPGAISQAVGGPEGWRASFTSIATQVLEGTADTVYIKFPELPYFLGEARGQGFELPMTEAVYTFCDAGPRDWKDNMGRPTVSLWHVLVKSSRLPDTDA